MYIKCILIQINVHNKYIRQDLILSEVFGFLDTPSFPLFLLLRHFSRRQLAQSVSGLHMQLVEDSVKWVSLTWVHRDTCRCLHLFLLILPRILLSSSKFFQQLGGANTWRPPEEDIFVPQEKSKPNCSVAFGEFFFCCMNTLIMLAIFELGNSSVFSSARWTQIYLNMNTLPL